MPLNEWLESNHRYQWFLVWQTIGSDGFSMVLVWPTIGTNGFSMVFPLETMVFQWFWVWQTIGTDGFSMVFSLETMVFQWFPMVANHWSNDGMVTIHRYGLQYMLNIAQCTCTHLLKGRAHIKWSKNLRISWQSYRYHQYPKNITSNLEPLLAYANNITELVADLRYFMMLIVRLLFIPTQDLLAL